MLLMSSRVGNMPAKVRQLSGSRAAETAGVLRRRRASLEKSQRSRWQQSNEGHHEKAGADTAAPSSIKSPEAQASVSCVDPKPAVCRTNRLRQRGALMWVLLQVYGGIMGCP